MRLNVNHCAAAQNLLIQTAEKRNIDFMLVSETFVTKRGQSSMIPDESGKRAIMLCTSLHVQELAASPMRGVAYAKIKHMQINFLRYKLLKNNNFLFFNIFIGVKLFNLSLY